ncbi:MAG: 3-methyl-2-oxobutanoate dehydrogenase subunit VorB [Oscillospiraceae bacterium]|jgi:2-oxoglutarate ferredoxin oxidoreductase subunit alpha|nr:3-methyl-2-oxobutanoate dehydrogenase subunit VorB [Oscillospiraceae bacterium]
MAEKVLMKGNEAIAEAAILSGCLHYFGYPITPQTEIAAYMAKRMPKVNGCFLQAESEVAAINMVIGASAAGRRTMTSSSSPGIALKSEGLSYLAGCDLPAVVVNIQRGGPGLGGIQPSQADYFQATKGGGHGDYRMLVLAPASVQEMFDLTALAFELADQYRVTSMLFSDGILGQMMEAVDISSLCAQANESPAQKPWALTGTRNARKPNIINSLYMQPEDLERVNRERFVRYAEIAAKETRWEEFLTEDAQVIVVAYGAAARIAKNAINAARAQGIKAGLLRPVTLWPFPKEALGRLSACARTKGFVCVELSMGQMIEDVELATRCAKPVRLVSRTGGMVPSPDEIIEKIRKVNAIENGRGG